MMKKSILLMILCSVVSFNSVAGDKALQNYVQLEYQGMDPATQALIYEGTSTGEIGTGTLEIKVFPFQVTDSTLHFSANWSFMDDSGASMTGANSGRLDLGALTIHERGIVLSCTEELSNLCGCPFRFEGMASDNEFIPYVTTAYGQSSIFVDKDNDCIGTSGKDRGKDKYKHKTKKKDQHKNKH
jgi:hypothetical protein